MPGIPSQQVGVDVPWRVTQALLVTVDVGIRSSLCRRDQRGFTSKPIPSQPVSPIREWRNRPAVGEMYSYRDCTNRQYGGSTLCRNEEAWAVIVRDRRRGETKAGSQFRTSDTNEINRKGREKIDRDGTGQGLRNKSNPDRRRKEALQKDVDQPTPATDRGYPRYGTVEPILNRAVRCRVPEYVRTQSRALNPRLLCLDLREWAQEDSKEPTKR